MAVRTWQDAFEGKGEERNSASGLFPSKEMIVLEAACLQVSSEDIGEKQSSQDCTVSLPEKRKCPKLVCCILPSGGAYYTLVICCVCLILAY